MSSNPNDKAIELLRKNKDILAIDWIKLSSNPNNKAIMINIKPKICQNEGYMKQLSYNHHEILNMIHIIRKKRVLNHIKKFIIWMI
jgi:hypothetical protein